MSLLAVCPFFAGTTRRFLREDLSLECDTAEYSAVRRDAFILVGLWPVGVPVMYAALIFAGRKALASRKPSLLHSGIGFITAGYTPFAFWCAVRAKRLRGLSFLRHLSTMLVVVYWLALPHALVGSVTLTLTHMSPALDCCRLCA